MLMIPSPLDCFGDAANRQMSPRPEPLLHLFCLSLMTCLSRRPGGKALAGHERLIMCLLDRIGFQDPLASCHVFRGETWRTGSADSVKASCCISWAGFPLPELLDLFSLLFSSLRAYSLACRRNDKPVCKLHKMGSRDEHPRKCSGSNAFKKFLESIGIVSRTVHARNK